MSGKFGELISKARESKQIPANQDSVLPENQITSQEPEVIIEKEKDVNLSIKVPESLRRHWVSEAKRQGTSLTAVITEALTAKFGRPD